MERRHSLLVVERPEKPFSVVAVVSGDGFAQIARELGAESVVVARDANPSVRELLLAVNACLSERVYLLADDPNVALVAREVAGLTERDVSLVATQDVPSGLAVLLELSGAGERPPAPEGLLANAASLGVAEVFFAEKDSGPGGIALKRGTPRARFAGKLYPARTVSDGVVEVASAMGAAQGGLLTLYYGGTQKERDARQITARLAQRFDGIEVEYYYGGQRACEFVISFER